MKITIKLHGGNDTMKTPHEFANVMQEAATHIRENREASDAIEHGYYYRRTFRDANGNTVGVLQIEE